MPLGWEGGNCILKRWVGMGSQTIGGLTDRGKLLFLRLSGGFLSYLDHPNRAAFSSEPPLRSALPFTAGTLPLWYPRVPLQWPASFRPSCQAAPSLIICRRSPQINYKTGFPLGRFAPWDLGVLAAISCPEGYRPGLVGRLVLPCPLLVQGGI